MSAADSLPLDATVEPTTQDKAVAEIRRAYASQTPLYPIGGGTSLDFGLPARQRGIGLRLTALNRVVDYPAGDMTITVEAGMTMDALAAQLAREGQRLPVDAAHADRATLGGLIATNFSGPRRYGYGTIRDYVIGISAIDGRGTPFKGGGRVVKNVAGYDFCKLLTGSLGTLAVITQVTLKVRPLAETTALLTCPVPSWRDAEPLLAALVSSRTTPAAIELVGGPYWQSDSMTNVAGDMAGRLIVGFEGTSPEVQWQCGQLASEWRELGVAAIDEHAGEAAQRLWNRLVDFPSQPAALTIKANLPPSTVAGFIELLRELDAELSLQAHAGNGIVVAQFAEFSPTDAGRVLVQRLQPAASRVGGKMIVWSCPSGELTRQAVWGVAGLDAHLMREVKHQFDPQGLLNPGRFVYL
ncbi:MAG TPA: FAD-binding oxidoreductase [Pirellulales bacterium]